MVWTEHNTMQAYAELIRVIAPLDDDLYGCAAPVEAIRKIQEVTAICCDDFKAKYGKSYAEVSLGGG
jgi:hypothetical protein